MSGEQINTPIKARLKSFLLICISLLFSISLILFSAFRVHQTQAQAQMEAKDIVVEATAEVIQTEQELVKVETVDYYLAYPGILPDHPLYWLKMIRDKVLLTCTREPVAKFERLLLYADKRLGAAKALIEGGKVELGLTTVTKGEKYLEQALSQFYKLNESDKTNSQIKEKIVKATLKHQEILIALQDKVSDQAKPTLEAALEKSKIGYDKLKELKIVPEEKQENKETINIPDPFESSLAECSSSKDCYVPEDCLPTHCLNKSEQAPLLCMNKEEQQLASAEEEGLNCLCEDGKCQWVKN